MSRLRRDAPEPLRAIELLAGRGRTILTTDQAVVGVRVPADPARDRRGDGHHAHAAVLCRLVAVLGVRVPRAVMGC
jgi:hypothetical protein